MQDTKEPVLVEEQESAKPEKEEKVVSYRRCQRKDKCNGAKAVNQFLDGPGPVLVCPACQTARERALVEHGPFSDPEPPEVPVVEA